MEIIKSVNEERVVGIKGTDKELARLALCLDELFDWGVAEEDYELPAGFFYSLSVALEGADD